MRNLRRPRLSRGLRTLINLTLCALLLVGLWGLMGYPLPTAELEVRRWERQNLLKPGEAVLSVGAEEPLEGLAGGWSVSFNHPMVVSAAEDGAVIGGKFRRWSFSHVSWGEEPLVVQIPGIFSLAAFSQAGPEVRTPVLAFNLPEGTAGGEITLRACRGTAEVPLTGPGWEIGRGVWLFAAGTSQDVWTLAGDAPCALRLFRSDGSALLDWEGTLGG